MRSNLLLLWHRKMTLLAIAFALGFSARSAISQVSPNEILNPDLKALEQTYFRELIGINQSVAKTSFPFPVYLSRYVGLDPAKQAEADSRGLEFVRFQDRTILKITGNYNAAYNALSMTRNDRAAATFHSVVLPILTVVTAALPEDLACDGIGFEISHHARTNNGSYDYEGKEILVVVFGRTDAWAMSRAGTDAQRQEILNRNKIFLNGNDYGLSLTEHDPLNVETLSRSIPAKPDATSTARSAIMGSQSPVMRVGSGSFQLATAQTRIEAPVPQADASPPAPTAVDPPPATPGPTQADADQMDEEYQSQLAALHKEGTTKFHFVAYAPPTFVLFQDKLTLQMTLKNSLQFDPAKTSIYKRTAQSFDLFLAPLLKDLSARISPDVEFQLVDFTVLNRLSPGAKESSEAVEFICPWAAVKQFISAEITNQKLLDQSIILVNGVRIALNLQMVE
jgi:hypothetical protein